MVTALPWRTTHPLLAHTRMESPRSAPRPRAPTSSVPSTQTQAEDGDVVVAGVGEHLEEPDDAEDQREPGLRTPAAPAAP